VGQISLYWNILYSNILPVFLTAGSGFVLGRTFRPDIRAISRLSFYIFSPSLVFTSITHSTLSGAEFGQMALFAAIIIVSMTLLSVACGIALRLERHMLASFVIAAIFVNAGNYGMPLNQFAFGDVALPLAAVYYSISSVAVYTLGVLIASLGRRPLRAVLVHSLTLPTTYALLGAGVLGLTQWALPQPVDRALALLGQGAIPVLLVVLGLQIASVRQWPRERLGLAAIATVLQLVVAPLLALGLAGLMGLNGPIRQAAILESAMPAAVIIIILSAEYELDSAFVSSTVVMSTLLSPLTLTPLIAFLQR
jgi:malate permease and related proteins